MMSRYHFDQLIPAVIHNAYEHLLLPSDAHRALGIKEQLELQFVCHIKSILLRSTTMLHVTLR